MSGERSAASGCLLVFVSGTATVVGFSLGGLYCGDDAAWIAALAALAVGPAAVGAALYKGFGGHMIIRATVAILVAGGCFALLAFLVLLINLGHCPLL